MLAKLAPPGSLIFYSTKSTQAFVGAVKEVNFGDYYHVAIVTDRGTVIDASQSEGVREKSLEESIKCLTPDYVEIVDTNLTEEQRRRVVRTAEESLGCPYNDVFCASLLNSSGQRSFYCSQLVTEAFKDLVEWPHHTLNFNTATGTLSKYWQEYYQQRNRTVPQGEPGSHPSQLRRAQDLKPLMRISTNLKFEAIYESAHWVGGSAVNLVSERSFDVVEPRNGKVKANWTYATPNQVTSTVKLAKEAQKIWAKTSWIQRSEVLNNVAKILKEKSDEIAHWECVDNGKPIYEAKADVLSCVDTFNFYSGVAANLLGTHVPLDSTRYAFTKKMPIGVVACIGAWNYPIQTCAWKTAPALACGNAVIYKPSPLAPVTALLMGRILKEAGLPDGVFNVLQGDATTAQALIADPNVNKVSFTGSIPTGKAIMKACADRRIKPVTMELGGKSSLIVCDDADVDSAVACAMMANFFSQGQVCSNASKVIVHKSLLEEFTKKLIEKTKNLRIGDPLDENTKVGAHICKEHGEKVKGYIDGAITEGAKLLYGGKKVDVDGCSGGFYLEPCILTDITPEMRVYKEEIFGSVLLVIPFEKEQDSIDMANDTDMGLAAGVVTRSIEKSQRITEQLNAGNVYVNTYNDVSPLVPFGGIGESGFGRENGLAALEHYTTIKSVFVNTGSCENPF